MSKKRRNTKAVGPCEAYLDQLWSKAVKLKFDHRCVRCGNPNVQSHHVRGRRRRALRWEIRNGIALCPYCHRAVHNYPWTTTEIMHKANINMQFLQEKDVPLKDYLHRLGISKKQFRERTAKQLNEFIKAHESDKGPKSNYDLRGEEPF